MVKEGEYYIFRNSELKEIQSNMSFDYISLPIGKIVDIHGNVLVLEFTKIEIAIKKVSSFYHSFIWEKLGVFEPIIVDKIPTYEKYVVTEWAKIQEQQKPLRELQSKLNKKIKEMEEEEEKKTSSRRVFKTKLFNTYGLINICPQCENKLEDSKVFGNSHHVCKACNLEISSFGVTLTGDQRIYDSDSLRKLRIKLFEQSLLEG